MEKTHPAGQKTANAWQLYDMHGNVWEWCQDWEGPYPSGAVENPEGPDAGWGRIQRGGGWNSGPVNCRSATRFWEEPNYSDAYLGFRVCRDADE